MVWIKLNELDESVRASLSIKWKDVRGTPFPGSNTTLWLIECGHVEVGLDVRVEAKTTGESDHVLYLVSGRSVGTLITKYAASESGLSDPQGLSVALGQNLFYCRLSFAGEAGKRRREWPDRTVPFRAEFVEHFDERETEQETRRYDADTSRYLYVRPSMMVDYKLLKHSTLKYQISENGIRRRVTGEEYARLTPDRHQLVVTGQEYESLQRDLIAILWPDLAWNVELKGSIHDYELARQRMKAWLGVDLPACHRDWRILAETIDLTPPEKLTQAWLADVLAARLTVLWNRKVKQNNPAESVPAAPLKPLTPDATRGTDELRTPELDDRPEDYQYEGNWLTAAYCAERFELDDSSLSVWAKDGCPKLGGRKIRRRKFPPGQRRFCFHRIDINELIDALRPDEEECP